MRLISLILLLAVGAALWVKLGRPDLRHAGDGPRLHREAYDRCMHDDLLTASLIAAGRSAAEACRHEAELAAAFRRAEMPRAVASQRAAP